MRCIDCQRDVRQLHRGKCGACYRTWRKGNVAPNACCEHCGRPFFNATSRGHALCSRECYRAWKVGRAADNTLIPSRAHPEVNGEGKVRMACECCGEPFFVMPYELERDPRFCSPKCNGMRRSVPRTVLTCDHCGRTYRYLPARLLLVASRYCSRTCYEEARRIHRLAREIGRGREYRRFRDEQVERAGVCTLCGASDDLVLHHRTRTRERPDLLLEKENLEVVCRACHTHLHAKQGHYRCPEVAA